MKNITLLSLFMCCIFTCTIYAQKKENNGIKLSGIINQIPDIGDTLTFRIYEDVYATNSYINNPLFTPFKEYKIPIENDRFNQEIILNNEASYYTLSYTDTVTNTPKHIILLGLIALGDSLFFDVGTSIVQIDGSGWERQQLTQKLDSLRRSIGTHIEKLEQGVRVIEKYNHLVQSQLLQQIQADHLSILLSNRQMYLNAALNSALRNTSEQGKFSVIKDSIIQAYKWQEYAPYIEIVENTNDEVKVKSHSYAAYHYYAWHYDQLTQMSSNAESYIMDVRKIGVKELRDRLWAHYFLKFYNAQSNENTEMQLNQAIAMTTIPKYKEVLTTLYNMKKMGNVAYDFALPDERGKIHQLSDYKGKFVFIDFWFTGCGACSQYYLSHLSKLEEHFQQHENVVFLSISTDRNRSQWLKSVDSGYYTSDNSPNVINLYTDGYGISHPVILENGITGYPTLLFLGDDGRILSYNGFRGLTVEQTMRAISSYVE